MKLPFLLFAVVHVSFSDVLEAIEGERWAILDVHLLVVIYVRLASIRIIKNIRKKDEYAIP